jgi:hypothetical protein
VCKGACLYSEYPATQDDHDSGNVYNLYRVSTIILVVLMIMSGMDPHMIRGTLCWEMSHGHSLSILISQFPTLVE